MLLLLCPKGETKRKNKRDRMGLADLCKRNDIELAIEEVRLRPNFRASAKKLTITCRDERQTGLVGVGVRRLETTGGRRPVPSRRYHHCRRHRHNHHQEKKIYEAKTNYISGYMECIV